MIDAIYARKSILIGALLFSLLLPAPSLAGAECAWVLWVQITSVALKGQTLRRWSIVKAEETKGDCETTAKVVIGSTYSREAGRAALDEGKLEIKPMWMKEVKPDGSVIVSQFYCIPSTIDPRPKGDDR